jgi:hypothetical protein
MTELRISFHAMKQETLQAQGDDGKIYSVVRTTPLILGSGLEGIPSYRLDSGELLVPTAVPSRFKLPGSGVVITLADE